VRISKDINNLKLNSILETLIYDLKVLAPKLKTLQYGLKELEATKRDFTQDQSAQDRLNERVMTLTQHTEDIRARTEDALNKLYNGKLIEADLTEMENQRLKDIDPARQFCEGAKRFQSSNKNDDYLSEIAARSPSKTGWGYICECCGLEVGYYPAARISSTGKALDSSILLTASHLIAFKSIKERRAFYRCLQCYKNRELIDFPSALAFEKHMEKHPEFTLMKKQDEVQKLRYMVARQERFMDSVETAKEGPEETVAKAIGPQDYQAGTTSGRDRPDDRTMSGEERDKGIHAKEVTRKNVSTLGEEEDDTLRLPGGLPSKSDYRNNRTHEEEGLNPKLPTHRSPGGLADGEPAEIVQSRRSQYHEVKHDMPGSFPSGASTSSAAISDLEMDSSTHSTSRSPSAEGASVYSDVIGNNQPSRTSGSFFMGGLADESANLPIGLVERPSEPRSEVMSPAPADLLARVSPPVPSRRPATQHAKSRSSEESYTSLPVDTSAREASSLGLQQQRSQNPLSHQPGPSKTPGNKPLSNQNNRPERAAPQALAATQQQTIETTPPERAATQAPTATQPAPRVTSSTQQGVQNMPPARSPASLPSKSQPSSVQNTSAAQAKQDPASRATITTASRSGSGTWEAFGSDKFVYYDADGKALNDQTHPPLDQWILSKRGYQGHTGMHWAIIKSGSEEVVYAAQDPRQAGRNG
jgi:hypothetical protein